MQRFRYPLAFLLALLLGSGSAHARQQFEKRSGEYMIYYSLFPSSFLQPDIAARYGITRAKDRAILNVSVRRGEGADSQAKSAVVRGTSSDLIHSHELQFEEIRERDAIYYLAEVRVSSDATLYFDLQISPDPNKPAIELQFNREVVTE